MRTHSRRRFNGQLFAASIGSTSLSRISGATNDSFSDGLVELCVTTRASGILPNVLVDVWTGQIGSLDFRKLPEQLGRVVVWSDVRGHRSFARSIADILLAIEEYFGIKPLLGSKPTAHVGHSSGLSRSIEKPFNSFEPTSLGAIEHRMAVIDLSSCGLTRLRS